MQNDDEKISIIVPFHSLEEFLPKCLNSLKEQTYQNFEVIMVANNVADNSTKIAMEFAQNDNRFVLKEFSKKQVNISAVRNFGLDCATGKYIAWVDADDYVSKEYLQNLYDAIQKENCQMSICDKIFSKSRNKRFGKHKVKEKMFSAEKMQKLCLKTNKYGGFLWNKLFLSEIAKGITFEEEYTKCEDLLFVMKYLDQCQNVNYINKKLYLYYKNANGISSNFKKMENGLKVVAACERIIELSAGKAYNANAVLKCGLQSIDVILRNSKLLKSKEYSSLNKKLAENLKRANLCLKNKSKNGLEYALWQKVVVKTFYSKYKKYL